MSPPSPPSSDHPWTYDVFINFRGEDTRRSFVSILYAGLSNAGIRTFLDNEELIKGDELGPALKKAIEESHIAIVVLSKNYAESSWCLDELVHIMECRDYYGQVVIPVFYDIDPSDVRKQTGNFGEALKVTARKKQDRLSEWRTALTQVANISGYHFHATSFIRTETELVSKIIEDIFTKLDNSFLSITQYPIGLESRVRQITKFIDDQSRKVCMIGIWGMGGSGKTTTAKAIYNQIHRRFKGKTSYIESIREVCDTNSRGIIHLQQQLLLDLLKEKKEIHSIALGINYIEKRLRGQKAFVVLDDVTKYEQLQALCRNPKLFGSGSVLIITTRDLSLLDLHQVHCVFKIKEMDENQSLQLFSCHAFQKPRPKTNFSELSTDVVENQSLQLFSCHAFQKPRPKTNFSELSTDVVAYCGGLPLALEVLGSYLYNRTKQEWRSVLSKLKKIPNDQVQEKLRISYDGLKDHMEKDIFLDICCFFIGKNRADVTEILNGCGLHAGIGIAVLIDRSLLKVGKNNKLQMHDLLRDMGREIVRESSPNKAANQSRLWRYEDVLHVLSKENGTETVEGLILKLQRTARIRFGTHAFQEMKNLRLLKLDGVHLNGDYGLISKQLIWIDWQRSNFNFVPDDFYQGNLVVFELKYSNVKQVWQETKLLEKLKVLNLSHSKYLRSTPDFSKLPNLEKLIMKDCPSLSEVHSSIGDLKNLLLINFRDCTSLDNLPREVYRLISVKTLILSGCSKIDKLEEDILQMESLTKLIAPDISVKEGPFSIVRLKSIAYISLCGYEGLTRDIFPSLIKSWMSPTRNSLPRVSPFGGNSLSRVSLDIVESNNMGYQSPMPSTLTKLRSVCVRCHSENQLTQELRRFLDDLYDVNFIELETSHGAQSSNLSLRSLVIGMGSSQIFMDTLKKSLSKVPSLSFHLY
ncbi:disease resistance protein (TIR-NBS-LRR class) [Trifolium pratense]|uniref:ADP-ribosyl cyclase/cyclic ADP-ribose hydrolase n=1 Tax=Trifolium pratense TaxID=57577 RepID=A0A2K3N4B0_TRIPR|nr:disease resistance protein (TIR-NBS-LRR class) [Trifolium pratense]